MVCIVELSTPQPAGVKRRWPTNPAPPLTQFFPSQTPLPRLRFLDLAAAGAQFLLAVGPRGLRTPAPGRGGAEPTLRRPSRGGVARGNTQTGCCVVRWSGLPCTGWPAADLAGTRVAYLSENSNTCIVTRLLGNNSAAVRPTVSAACFIYPEN